MIQLVLKHASSQHCTYGLYDPFSLLLINPSQTVGTTDIPLKLPVNINTLIQLYIARTVTLRLAQCPNLLTKQNMLDLFITYLNYKKYMLYSFTLNLVDFIFLNVSL